MLLSATTYGQDIAAVTLSGKTLKVEYDDNSVRYMRKVIHAEAEAFIYGLDAIDNGFKIQYANVSATTKATETLTLTGNLSDGDTIVIGAKNYVAQETLTDVDGHFHIGATASATIDNLIAAINLTDGAVAVDYASATTINSQVSAAAGAGDTMDITAKAGGTAANSIATTETSATASWGAATMSGGEANGKLDLIALADSWAAAQ